VQDNRIGVSANGKNHFTRVIESRDGDSEVVLLMVGSEDLNKGAAMNVPERTVENIKVISMELRAREKFTVVHLIPINPTWTDEKKSSVKDRNSLIREWLERYYLNYIFYNGMFR
jgi:hypothetical protein